MNKRNARIYNLQTLQKNRNLVGIWYHMKTTRRLEVALVDIV